MPGAPRLEVVILVGLQASGKTRFFAERLEPSHAHVSKDLYRSARKKGRRQSREIAAALRAGRSVAVDNTNLTRQDRREILEQARSLDARVVCFYFESKLDRCLERNALREGRARVPDIAVRAASGRLELPAASEGFDQMWHVRMDGAGGFVVEPWEER